MTKEPARYTLLLQTTFSPEVLLSKKLCASQVGPGIGLRRLYALRTCSRHIMGVARGERGAQFPGRRVIMGALNHCGGHRMAAGGAEKSQQCHKYFLQNSTFASERPQFRK